MDAGLCPECAASGVESRLEYLLHDDMSLVLCADNDCPLNYRGYHVVRTREESPLSSQLLNRLCADNYCPQTILAEPRLQYRHLMKLFWLIEMKKSNIYLWLSEEIGSMAYARRERPRGCKNIRYQLTPSAKQMMELTDEEVHVGKHVIPDLRKIVCTLRIQYQIHLDSIK